MVIVSALPAVVPLLVAAICPSVCVITLPAVVCVLTVLAWPLVRLKALPAVVPLQVAIADPAGRSAEFSGYYGAKNGTLCLRLDLAANDRPGVWQIQVRELASGRAAARYLRVLAEKSTLP